MFEPIKAKTRMCCQNLAESCGADGCMAWRWETITTSHPLWADAVRAKAAELDEKAPFPKSARFVADNKASLGMIPTRGFCGLAGEPK